ncbi:AAA family ATPase [Metabacillus malikii]|uniref:Cytidylate kinase n=1 Tax=Metabacillus malikii TaxID=1504265 RepID=A0ABT9ZKG5_9BACI|nr:AAA family ATPase [Metabacillus malikii]MDQ0232470.1 cytidylate kinase [Metabacillus malikii]
MIIWINGTFGVGKSTVAYELQRRLPLSFVYDPERFGSALMGNIPKELAKGDFQDYPLWREANYKTLKQVATEYIGTIIVPMTITNDTYYNEIIGKLQEDGIEVSHFTLTATPQTIEKRLRKRFEGKKSWAYQQADERINVLSDERFKEHIPTDTMTIDDIVNLIANTTGLTLLPDIRTKSRRSFERLKITLQEANLFK